MFRTGYGWIQRSCSLDLRRLLALRSFATSATRFNKALPSRSKIDEAEIEENFVKGTGPGGQKINKTSSAVQLIHHPTGIVVKNQETRSRTQNRKLARQQLADQIDLLQNGEDSRLTLKANKAQKKKASADKKKRRKYRKLGETSQVDIEKEGRPERQTHHGATEEGHRPNADPSKP